jgi:HK97 family phage major capsid protein
MLERHDQYLNERNKLVDHAQKELTNGNVEACNRIRAEIEAIDKQYKAEQEEWKKLSNMQVAPNAPEFMDVTVDHGRTMDAMDVTNTVDYRRAFKDSVLQRKAMPVRFQNASTLTTDVESVVPTVLVNKIIEKMESIGMILPLITRTSYAAGVDIPTSMVKPVASWVAEGTGSTRQKKTTGAVSFKNYKLRCEISMSMEVAAMSIEAFEATFVRQVAEAMVKAIEGKIISADAGTGSPRGIFAETPLAGQTIEVSAINYQTLIDAEGALPQAYENGAAWIMAKSTFMAIRGMTDSTGQPIGFMDPKNSVEPYTLLGRKVVLCGDYMASFNAAAEGDVFAAIFNLKDYVLNTVYDMGIQRKQDWDTEDMLAKAVMNVDGKVVDVNSLVTLTKGPVTP